VGARENLPTVPGQHETARPCETGCRRDALPAGPPGAGDHGRGDGWSSFHRVRSGRKPAPCPEGDPRPLPGGRLRAPRQPVNRVPPLRATVRGPRRWLRYVAGVLVVAGVFATIAFPQAALYALQLPLLPVFFLIFPRLSSTMAFGVYEPLTTSPQDLEAAAASFGLTGWLRFRFLAFPAAIPKLVYNSILSWTNGWFFLVASEIFTAGGTEFQRPGLGAFIAIAGRNGDTPSIAIGIGVLAAVVLALDIFLWRPLGAYSERFRMETATGREIPRVPSPYERFRWLPRLPRVRHWILARLQPVALGYHRLSLRFERSYSGHPKVIKDVRRIDLALFVVVFILVVSAGLFGLAQMFLRPLPPSAALLPSAAFLSFSRLLVAYGIALTWTVPVAAFLGESERASRYLTPVLELFASLPATALLPVIVGFALVLTASFGAAAQLAAILIALFSMSWYLLFNIIAGVRSIPDDL